MANGRRWTKQDEDYLREWYNKIEAVEIAEFLNRTEQSIRRKAEKLDLMFLRGLTEEQKTMIDGCYPYFTNKDILTMIPNSKGLTESSVRNYGFKMGYKKDAELYNICEATYITCFVCGKVVKRKPSEVTKRNYCSRKCSCSDRDGSSNPNWSGGIINLRKLTRNHTYKWRKASINHYNGKCAITNKDYVDVHHLDSFELMLDECMENLKLLVYDEISNYTDEELTLIQNKIIEVHDKGCLGVCLTEEMHADFHLKYGYRHNTKQQFIEYCKKYHNIDYKPIYSKER